MRGRNRRPTCARCNAVPPDMGNGYTTLASASPSTGWHLSRVVQADGSTSVLWQCPKCWQKHRAEAKAPRAKSPASVIVSPHRR